MVITIILVVVFLILLGIYAVLAKLYTKGFGKHTPLEGRRLTHYYDFYRSKYPRRELVFPGKAAQLHGFVYGEDNTKALVVIAHGIGSFHESYLSTITWLVDRGYRVFAPDFSGSGSSTGVTTGLFQSAIDMDTVLTYIEEDESLNKLPKVLLGHSWGSYGVGAVLNYKHDVKAVVNVAGYNDPVDMIAFTLSLAVGRIANLVKPFYWVHHRLHYGKPGVYRVVDGINKANIPVLIVQGAEDPINTPDGTGIFAHRAQITNPYVEYMYITKKDCANHGSPFHTDEANAVLAKLERDIAPIRKEFTGEELERKLDPYYAALDEDLLSTPNADFLCKVDSFYSRALAGQHVAASGGNQGEENA